LLKPIQIGAKLSFVLLITNHMQKGIVAVFVVIVILYVITAQKKMNKTDLSLLIISIVALTWKFMTSRSIMEANRESYVDLSDVPTSLSQVLSTMKPIDDEEDITPISKNMMMYVTAFNSLSYTPNTREWRNMMDTVKTKTGSLKCDSSLYFDLLPSYSKVTGFTLGPNKITGPYSNTLGITYRGQYSVVMAFTHGNLRNDTTQTNKIELIKLWANSANNNGISLFIEPGSIQVVNNTQFGRLMFQYGDYSPVLCRISENDDLIPIENNVLCFLFVVKYDDKVRVLYMTEKSNNVITLAEFNVATTDVTFSNKELAINRFGNWNSNMYGFGVFKTALNDVTITNVYQHIKSLYAKTNDPSYKPIVDTYNETIDKLSKYLQCPFDEVTCAACKDVEEWNDITQVINAPQKCRKAISTFCKANSTHPFCKCWDKKSDAFNSSSCKMVKTIFDADDTVCMTRSEVENLKQGCNKVSGGNNSDIRYDNRYTFDKVRVKYEDGLTTKERVRMGKDVAMPDFMTTTDYQQGMSRSSLRLQDGSAKAQAQASSANAANAANDKTSEKELLKDVKDTIEESSNSEGGFWSFFKLFS